MNEVSRLPVSADHSATNPAPESSQVTLGWRWLARDVPRLLDYRRRKVVHRHAVMPKARDAFSGYAAIANVSGSLELRTTGSIVCIAPGEIVLHDLRQLADLRFEDSLAVVTRLERWVVETARGSVVPTDTVVVGATAALALGALFRRSIGSGMLADSYRGEAAACLAADFAAGESRAPSATASRLAAIRRAVDDRLPDRSLDAEAVARAAGISRSTLYRVLEPFGGIGRLLIQCRLDRLCALLAQPGASASLTELADQVGFASASHASRAFLNLYGLRPGQFRSSFGKPAHEPYAAMALRLWTAEFDAGDGEWLPSVVGSSAVFVD